MKEFSPESTVPTGGTAGAGGLGTRSFGGGLTRDDTTPRAGRQIVLYADGACEPRNPGGYACWGWLATDGAGGFLATGKGCVGHGDGMTNNVAEYHGALEALRWAAGQGLRDVLLRLDSQLVVNQAMGVWGCSANHLWPLLVELRALMAETGARLEWIPRGENGRADALSRQAVAEARRNGDGRQ